MFNFIKKIWVKIKSADKKLIGSVSLAAAVLILAPNIADGQAGPIGWLLGGLIDIQYTLIAKVFFGISWVISLLGGLLVSVIIFFLEMVINISNGIVNAPPVRVGFPIVLGVANLGFVTAIIVIAIGTILRSQTYNMKKMLANVVIMAVLVNFGLVISGAIIGFSNKVTTYFLESMTGGNPFNFATIMAQTMNPQKAILSLEGIKIDEVGKEESQQDKDTLAGLGTMATGKIGGFLIPIISLNLTIITLVLMIITLAILVFSFIVRYIKLTFALILLPGAWMASVFPSLKSWNKKWWDLFIKQAIYPPVVLFFIWLAMRVQADMAALPELNFQSTGDGVFKILGNIIGVPLQTVLQSAVLAGLMLGGDYVAKAMGAAGAGVAIKTSDGMKKWAGGRAKYFGQRAGVRALDTGVAKKATEKLSSLGASSGPAGRFLTAPLRQLGYQGVRAKEKMSSSAAKSYKDAVDKMGDEELKARAKAATGLELAAILDKANKNPKLMRGVIDNIPEEVKQNLSNDKELYKRYGYEKTHEAAMLESGVTIAEKHKTFEAAKNAYDKKMADANLSEAQKEEAAKEFVKAEKEFTDAIKKLSADGANSLLFAKKKDSDGKPTDEFVMPPEQRMATMQQLLTKGGWNPGTFTEFLKKAQEGGNDDQIKELIKDMDAARIGPAFVKAMKNGAMKNLGLGGEDVFGEEKFNEAQKIHGSKNVKDRRRETRDRLKKEGKNYSDGVLDDLEAADNLDE